MSQTTRARLTPEVTALAKTTISSRVIGRVEEYPTTVLAAESPTSRTSIPDSSKRFAIIVSYAVSIANLRPSALAFCKWWTRTRPPGACAADVEFAGTGG